MITKPEMLTKELGRTGVQIPEIGLGTWNYHGGTAPLRAGLEAGARFIDTAESYGSEAVVGEAIRGIRQQVFLATKLSPEHFRRTAVKTAAEQSLHRLGTDYLDLYQLHQPNNKVPIEETLGAMEDLVDAGKVRFVGVSNFNLTQLQTAQRAMRKHPIVSNQLRFNLVDRTIEAGLLPYCQANHVTVIAHTPLSRGLGRILDCDPHGVLRKLAGATGKSVAQIALNWCLCRDQVVAIPKGNSIEHVFENCTASGWRLTREHLTILDREILFRRRGRFDRWLRRCLPADLVRPLQSLSGYLPPALRRMLN